MELTEHQRMEVTLMIRDAMKLMLDKWSEEQDAKFKIMMDEWRKEQDTKMKVMFASWDKVTNSMIRRLEKHDQKFDDIKKAVDE